MNHAALLAEMKRLELTDAQALNLLTEARIISDNCVRVWDIAQPDLARAVDFFKARNTPPKS